MYGTDVDILKEDLASGKISPVLFNTMLNKAMSTSDNAKMLVVEGSAGNAISASVSKFLMGDLNDG